MNKEQFIKYVEDLNIKITSKQLDQLEKYYELLLSWNKLMNLTTIIEHDAVYLKHFYDSLTLIKACSLNEISSLADVGSGAGFPGLVLKIFYPELKITIIDSNNKKISFLKEVAQNLELKNITFVHDRCENFAHTNKENFDIVTARAVASLNILIELCLPLVKINGYFIALKGDVSKEEKTITNSLKILGGKQEKIIQFNLPYENSKRSIVKIQKVRTTPPIYPRSYDKIKKKPLK